jgi:hypothetical protein
MPLHKEWTWVGGFGPDLMLCAATARVGPLRASWWAVWDGERLHERAHRRAGRAGPVVATPERVRVRGILDLHVEPGAPWEVTTGPIWTRKRPARITGTALGRPVVLHGLVDESAGRHAREIAWMWCAGAGERADGRPVTWNLVDGIHDAPTGSERAVWIDGEPHEVGPQRFAADLSGVGELRFDEWCAREDHSRRGPFRSDYRQPFGAFSGSLPGGLELQSGYGVMEWHDVRW